MEMKVSALVQIGCVGVWIAVEPNNRIFIMLYVSGKLKLPNPNKPVKKLHIWIRISSFHKEQPVWIQIYISNASQHRINQS